MAARMETTRHPGIYKRGGRYVFSYRLGFASHAEARGGQAGLSPSLDRSTGRLGRRTPGARLNWRSKRERTRVVQLEPNERASIGHGSPAVAECLNELAAPERSPLKVEVRRSEARSRVGYLDPNPFPSRVHRELDV